MAERSKRTSNREINKMAEVPFDLGLGAGFLSIFWVHTQTQSWPVSIIVGLAIFFVGIVLSRMILSLKSSKNTVSSPKNNAKQKSNSPTPTGRSVRADDVILNTPLKKLNPYEFERLLALYFRDHGFEVEETGRTGDGGVDLILTDKKGYRTAVQAKHWNFGPVGPEIIRGTHSARMNPNPSCHFAMVVTSNDITPQARKEAEDRRMEYWHGGLLVHKLSNWPKWQANRNLRKLHRR